MEEKEVQIQSEHFYDESRHSILESSQHLSVEVEAGVDCLRRTLPSQHLLVQVVERSEGPIAQERDMQ